MFPVNDSVLKARRWQIQLLLCILCLTTVLVARTLRWLGCQGWLPESNWGYCHRFRRW